MCGLISGWAVGYVIVWDLDPPLLLPCARREEGLAARLGM